jgi:hypothetical protein
MTYKLMGIRLTNGSIGYVIHTNPSDKWHVNMGSTSPQTDRLLTFLISHWLRSVDVDLQIYGSCYLGDLTFRSVVMQTPLISLSSQSSN